MEFLLCYQKTPRVLRYITLKKTCHVLCGPVPNRPQPGNGCGLRVGDPDIEYSVCFIFGGGEWVLGSNSRFLIAKLAVKFQVLFNL